MILTKALETWGQQNIQILLEPLKSKSFDNFFSLIELELTELSSWACGFVFFFDRKNPTITMFHFHLPFTHCNCQGRAWVIRRQVWWTSTFSQLLEYMQQWARVINCWFSRFSYWDLCGLFYWKLFNRYQELAWRGWWAQSCTLTLAQKSRSSVWHSHYCMARIFEGKNKIELCFVSIIYKCKAQLWSDCFG